ncbi:uncharacterized protein LOC120644797 [Panicum virgatum]|uniref:Uncharacterized protein n=1 Tax=Panicum virgatum TaxID=38727 RepID=A0A8T0PPW0_PANVG|nr:uncharacterized protein LOC120644797 [Panicum virgatum]KAG2562978.1 hypothetical protein PVAP13_8KG306800 [Panicum virgatum]
MAASPRVCRCSFSNLAARRGRGAPGLLLAAAGGQRRAPSVLKVGSRSCEITEALGLRGRRQHGRGDERHGRSRFRVLLRHARLDSQSDAPLSLPTQICAPLLNLVGSRARPLRWVEVSGLFDWLHFFLLIWCSARPMPASGMLNRGTASKETGEGRMSLQGTSS